MNTPPPLPIKASENIWLTYTRAAVIIVPGLIFLSFTSIFLLPKVEAIWIMAGLSTSKAQWLITLNETLFSNEIYLVVGTLLVFTLLECYCRPWPRWRALVTLLVVALFNLYILFTLTTITVTACLALPKATALNPKKPPETPISHD
ncbi:hypothetical protein BH09VER1_BH09VER1_52310 [soil metagenome]